MTKKTVWETLSKINVNEHTEKKNGLTYLSWAWAWGVLKEHYPSAKFEKHIQPSGLPYIVDANGYAYVQVTVTADEESATELFPVLDHRNRAIQNPSAFDINTAMQRCLAKSISYLGLGHYIYAGEDLPQGDDAQSAPERPQKAKSAQPAPDTFMSKDAVQRPSDAEYEAIHATPDVVANDGTVKKTNGMDMIASVFTSFLPGCDTDESLRQFWAKNKTAIEALKNGSPDLYDEVVTAFKARKETLAKGKAE